jgi:nitrogen fixation protein FixH
MTHSFTGRHMALAMIGFFSVVIAVNIVMATIAERSFGGTVVDNSYVASQRFNAWLDAAARQDSEGWTLSTAHRGGHLVVAIATRGAAVDGGALIARVSHPLGVLPERMMHFRPIGGGRYLSDEALPAGRWRLHLTLHAHGREMRFVEDLAA